MDARLKNMDAVAWFLVLVEISYQTFDVFSAPPEPGDSSLFHNSHNPEASHCQCNKNIHY